MSLNDTTALPMNWESPPERRGTVQILFTCLTTLVFCVWSALHVDIQRRSKWHALFHKMGWVLCLIFTPELLIVIAYKQRRGALWLLGKHKEFHGSHNNSLPDPEKNQHNQSEEDMSHTRVPHVSRRYPWTLTHGFYAAMGGFVIAEDHVKNSLQDSFPYTNGSTTLTIKGVEFLFKHAPECIPDISEDSIMDHSKADGLAKTLQLVQVTWFCVNCVCRRAQGLPLSLLEVYTLAHAASMLVVYILWFKKPFEIREPTVIHLDHSLVSRFNTAELMVDKVRLISWAKGSLGNDTPVLMAFALLSALYGGVHFLAWGSKFPTSIEMKLWRISAVILTSAPSCFNIALFALFPVALLRDGSDNERVKWFLNLVTSWTFGSAGLILVLSYCPANLYVLVESFRQLLYLPPEAYQLPVWSNYWPHFG